jgi:N-acetyl-gamma-glutamyl-phosphate reductase
LLAKSVYGLPELYREQIKTADFIACPGCYPTSVLLPSIPLLRAKLVRPDNIIADSMSGVTGAGRKVESDYLFAECNESLRAYGIPKHRHLSELEQELAIVAGRQITLQFTPHLVPVNRGILTTLYFDLLEKVSDDLIRKVAATFHDAYDAEPFVRLVEGKTLPDTKNVVGTNFIEIGWRIDPRTNRLIVLSAEDNIVKGTSGQGIQCFNIMNGFPETAGLI